MELPFPATYYNYKVSVDQKYYQVYFLIIMKTKRKIKKCYVITFEVNFFQHFKQQYIHFRSLVIILFLHYSLNLNLGTEYLK